MCRQLPDAAASASRGGEFEPPCSGNGLGYELDDGRADTWKVNTPLDGLRYRAPPPYNSGGSQTTSMSIGSTGLNVAIGVNTARRFFSISVNRP